MLEFGFLEATSGFIWNFMTKLYGDVPEIFDKATTHIYWSDNLPCVEKLNRLFSKLKRKGTFNLRNS